MRNLIFAVTLIASACAFAKEATVTKEKQRPVLTSTLPSDAWPKNVWIAVPDAPVASEQDRKNHNAAPGVSWFVGKVRNVGEVVSAKWMTAGLGFVRAEYKSAAGLVKSAWRYEGTK